MRGGERREFLLPPRTELNYYTITSEQDDGRNHHGRGLKGLFMITY
jgi:hypothetical protein